MRRPGPRFLGNHFDFIVRVYKTLIRDNNVIVLSELRALWQQHNDHKHINQKYF